MNLATCRRALSTLLASALVVALPVGIVSADSPTRLSGRVLASDGFTPRAGVVVALHDDTNDRTYRSAPSTAEGTFRIDAAPAGTYGLVAETASGAFLADGGFRVSGESNRPVALTLRENRTPLESRINSQTGGGGGGGSGAGNLAPWAQWTIAGAIGVSALAIVNEVSKDEEELASAF